MTKKLSNEDQGKAARRSDARKRVAEIMKAHVIEPGARANFAPWFLQIYKMRSGPLADNHVGISLHAP